MTFKCGFCWPEVTKHSWKFPGNPPSLKLKVLRQTNYTLFSLQILLYCLKIVLLSSWNSRYTGVGWWCGWRHFSFLLAWKGNRSPGSMQKEAGCRNKEGLWATMGGVLLKVLEEADLGIGIGMRKKEWVLGDAPSQKSKFLWCVFNGRRCAFCCLVAGTWV